MIAARTQLDSVSTLVLTMASQRSAPKVLQSTGRVRALMDACPTRVVRASSVQEPPSGHPCCAATAPSTTTGRLHDCSGEVALCKSSLGLPCGLRYWCST